MREGSPSIVPPPWTLRGDAYVLPVWMPAGLELNGEYVPPGWERRRGGLSLLMFVRYRESSAGAYDELLWVRLRGVQSDRHWQHSVTSILVSTEASRAGGRANWGIPKRLATFDVAHGERSERVRISIGSEHVASFEVSVGARSLPCSAGIIPKRARTLVQELDGRRFEVTPSARGRLHLARFSRLSFGSGQFPDVTRGRLLPASSLRSFEMTFPPARVTDRRAERS